MKSPLAKLGIEPSFIRKTETKLEIHAPSHHVLYSFFLFLFNPSVLFKQYSPEFVRVWMVQQKLHSGQESNEANGY